MAKTKVCASGYFDPLHLGHLEYLEKSNNLGDELIVIVNNDAQAKLKKGKSYMKESDRVQIVKSLKCVDDAVLSIDKDKSVCKTLELIKPNIFTKGGDRFSDEIPESEVCKKYDIQIIDGLGDKIRSSSEIMDESIRPWGKYDVIKQIKIIEVNPNSKLSLQYYNNRTEWWTVLSGRGEVIVGKEKYSVKAGDEIFIPKKEIHRIITYNEPLKLREFCVGKISERDIVRLEDEYGRD